MIECLSSRAFPAFYCVMNMTPAITAMIGIVYNCDVMNGLRAKQISHRQKRNGDNLICTMEPGACLDVIHI